MLGRDWQVNRQLAAEMAVSWGMVGGPART
jgi:hypothetical protein